MADRYHDTVDVFNSQHRYTAQLDHELEGPCLMSLDGAGNLYVAGYHGDVKRFAPSPSFGAGTTIDSGPATGVASDPVTDDVYVDKRTAVVAYDSSGNPVESGGNPIAIGEGTLEDGYGVAVSGFGGDSEHSATAGRVYVADAGDNTVKVYDPAADRANPMEVIDGSEVPGGRFTSLRDSEVAVDEETGEIYVVDNLQPEHVEQPKAAVQIFDAGGAYEGHLLYGVVDGEPTGLAVSGGRIYVTSGNTHDGGLYAYTRPAATRQPLREPTIPPAPLGGGTLSPRIPIGGPAARDGGIACEGDSCQVLPSEPEDPTLTTLLQGLGNPAVRYRRALRDCRPSVRSARRTLRRFRRLARLARRLSGKPHRAARKARRRMHHVRALARRSRRRARGAARAARLCRRVNRGPSRHRGRAKPSASATASATVVPPPVAGGDSSGAVGSTGANASPAAIAANAPPIEAGFDAAAWSAEGEPASLAGSHPYELDLSLGLNQAGGESDMREARIELPEGLLANPAASGLCSATAFSAGLCSQRSQVGTLQLDSGRGGGERRTFGLFELEPTSGFAIQLGARPYGNPLVFGGRIGGDERGAALTLSAAVPAAIEARGLRLSLWGAPWDASHNTERGACLNEAEPLFPLASCSVGDPLQSDNRPLAFLTLPTSCGSPLVFSARTRSWGRSDVREVRSTSDDAGGTPVPLAGCSDLRFEADTEGLLNDKKASSPSGFVFRLRAEEDPGLSDPRGRIRSHPREVRIELPDGVTLNPSLGAGLKGCSPSQYASESPFSAQGKGCPNGSKIGDFEVQSPFYEGVLDGAIYLATPHDNPFDSLLGVYLVAKAADRGVLVTVAGEVVPDPDDGTLTATFARLPQLPYDKLEVTLRSGQRAPLVTPSHCGSVTTRIELNPAARGAKTLAGNASAISRTDSEISEGIGGGDCPSGKRPPFHPNVVAGGVNSAAGSYTPYFVHLSRDDDEQEITSYSLTLPEGVVGKLAGIPFCGEAAISRARHHDGFEEEAHPSCPAASQVGRTLSGYGVGSALTYAPGRIYLAGPYHGHPLSLVTINAATVGPFDLGTIVVRSAFSVNPHTAQLSIDSRASDPIPHIVDGVPLHLRDIRVYMDRDEFTRNPTGCAASQLVSTLTGAGSRLGDSSDDSVATATEHFQLLECLALNFRPRLGLRLRGATRRGAFPGLLAVFSARKGDADLQRITVTMPPTLFLAQNHIRNVCTRVQFAAERCPRGSIYGTAAADTPLFDEPLRGPVLLRSSKHKLPDLVADLRSGEVRIVLEGRIGPSKRGGIRAFFDGLPDAPIDRFVMRLAGGRRGLLTNSLNICRHSPRASVKALAHNNRGAIFTTRLRGKCNRSGARKGKRVRKRRNR